MVFMFIVCMHVTDPPFMDIYNMLYYYIDILFAYCNANCITKDSFIQITRRASTWRQFHFD